MIQPAPQPLDRVVVTPSEPAVENTQDERRNATFSEFDDKIARAI